ncbi:MAG: hypothetical protein WCF67_13820 [Chitinophagaceae bacterium]
MAATSYASIRSMSADFKTMLSNLEFPFPFDTEETTMVVLVDIEDDLGNIMAESPDKLALIIGLDNNNAPTVCILGANSSGEVLSAHVSGNLDGQQAWPSMQSIKFPDDTGYDSFFVAPS